jgi:hypothetical protein
LQSLIHHIWAGLRDGTALMDVAMGYREGDEIVDLFNGSGAVMQAIEDLSFRLDLELQ